MAAVSTAPVAVKDQAFRRSAPEPGHGQRPPDQARLYVRQRAPAHHLPAEQVDHGCQVQPALVGGDVGDVAAP